MLPRRRSEPNRRRALDCLEIQEAERHSLSFGPRSDKQILPESSAAIGGGCTPALRKTGLVSVQRAVAKSPLSICERGPTLIIEAPPATTT